MDKMKDFIICNCTKQILVTAKIKAKNNKYIKLYLNAIWEFCLTKCLYCLLRL